MAGQGVVVMVNSRAIQTSAVSMTSLPDNTNPTPFTNAQTWLLILASATLSVLALFRLDAKQSQLEDPKQAEVRHALQDATQRETVRQCLAEEPFVLVAKKVESTSSGNPESKNSKARIGEQLSLEDVADLFAKDPGWAQAHLENAARLAQCAYALNSLKDLRQPSAWEMAFTHGSSLNVVVRIARLILLGAFALCVSEAILRALKLANLPVIGLADIAKVMREGAVDRDPSQSAKVPGPLLSLIGTTPAQPLLPRRFGDKQRTRHKSRRAGLWSPGRCRRPANRGWSS
jgi:hypothetical protein